MGPDLAGSVMGNSVGGVVALGFHGRLGEEKEAGGRAALANRYRGAWGARLWLLCKNEKHPVPLRSSDSAELEHSAPLRPLRELSCGAEDIRTCPFYWKTRLLVCKRRSMIFTIRCVSMNLDLSV